MAEGRSERLREQLKDKVVLITGGVGGIGYATAKRFKEFGAKVAITDIKEAPPEGLGIIYDLFVKADGRSHAAAATVVSHVIEKYGRLDILFNNMGIGANGGDAVMQTTETVTPEDIKNVEDTNYHSHIWFTQAALPHMKNQGSGRVIFSSSVWASEAYTGSVSYSGSKASISKYAEVFHAENQKDPSRKNIHSNAIEWPAVDTPMLRANQKAHDETDGEKALSPHEAADIVVSVASDEHENGSIVRPSLVRDTAVAPS